ncbi:exopolysaccharide biosynthesis protein [Erythrobacter sp. SCSIO 43205]|uniref:exopolysaccharide biosynthesis protein n=1 Tax=Erythrobacter sp. SCSIO 43205 TaxID=2779361 RepID=UPI001CA7C09D|nr:exopolysaccharide biosynthesis protein [Erythrobacter sp. SCSIO 43205]UAB78530.1 exopolysaccharide biosynthesis protein [Erythrobacter sp. SCSIO 43205]
MAKKSQSSQEQSAEAVVDKLGELGAEDGEVCVDQVVETFGARGYGPMLLVPALLGASPLGGIPTVPSILALIIALIAGQMVVGRTHFWLPEFLSQRSVSGEKLQNARDALSKPAQVMDKLFHGRLEWATSDPMPRIASAIVMVLCAVIVPLELVPLAALLPFSAIAAFGLALTVRDGALMLLAIAISIVSLYTAANSLLF